MWDSRCTGSVAVPGHFLFCYLYTIESMKKYYLINASACSAQCLTSKSILESYQKCVATPNGIEAEFQYDHESGLLFQWQNGQKYVYENDLTPEAAEEHLLARTIESIESNPEETIRVFDNRQDALDFVDFSLDCVLETDDPYIEQMKEVRNMLSNA